MSLVSVIIPIYNEDYILPTCLDSVLAQTYRELEVILVNDGSTDRTPAICDEYASRDSRVRVIHQAKNMGRPAARNAGLDAATGKYIQFVDADDFILPEMTATLVRTIEAHETDDADMVICGFNWVDRKDGLEDVIRPGRMIPVGVMSAREFIELFVADHDLSPLNTLCNKFFRRDLIERKALRFRPELPILEDLGFVAEHIVCCRNVVSIPDRFYQIVSGVTERTITVINRYSPIFLWHRLSALRLLYKSATKLGVEGKALRSLTGMMANQIVGSVVHHCRRDATLPKDEILADLKRLSKQPDLREWLRNCRSPAGHSRLLPLLLRLGWITPLFYYARRRADKRFGRYYGIGITRL